MGLLQPFLLLFPSFPGYGGKLETLPASVALFVLDISFVDLHSRLPALLVQAWQPWHGIQACVGCAHRREFAHAMHLLSHFLFSRDVMRFYHPVVTVLTRLRHHLPLK